MTVSKQRPLCDSLNCNGALHVSTQALYYNRFRQLAEFLLVNQETRHQGRIDQ